MLAASVGRDGDIRALSEQGSPMRVRSGKLWPVRCVEEMARAPVVWRMTAFAVVVVVFAALSGCDGPAAVSDESAGVSDKAAAVSDKPAAVSDKTESREAVVIITKPTTDHYRRTPLPTREVQVGSDVRTVEYDCGRITEVRHIHASVTRYGIGLLAWASGGKEILFSFDGAIWLADDATG